MLHNVERTATVESSTEMSLLMIGQDDFVRIFLQREMDGVLPEHTSFLKYVPTRLLARIKELCLVS